MGRPPWPPYAELSLLVDHLWSHAAEGHRFNLLPGEETLTEVATLSQARRRFPYTRFRGRLPQASTIQLKKFTLAEESKNGADWNLLLFNKAGGSVSFRIQAKRLYPKGTFSPLKDTQTKRLISQAALQGAIPLFGLYQGPQYPKAPASVCSKPEVADRAGCVVRDASNLHAAKPGQSVKKWQQEAGIALPLQCLAFCYCYGNGNGNASPGDTSPDPFSPDHHDKFPDDVDTDRASQIVHEATFHSATNKVPGNEGMLERLLTSMRLAEAPPDDRLGPYWNEHRGEVNDEDAEEGGIFEGVSHLIVVDPRRSPRQ